MKPVVYDGIIWNLYIDVIMKPVDYEGIIWNTYIIGTY